ncbi:hypothetical protein ALC57_00832 [Trachymyrmex cornetzi]|uniref:Uncharacterized protein n=1 Tax=Trachymyrmex cornetzi TaxID=471704 RepID=A0A195EMQ6_9HYME|nr:hypothetical protein ALC57_00832 [Trachymyrmex cornetzi]
MLLEQRRSERHRRANIFLLEQTFLEQEKRDKELLNCTDNVHIEATGIKNNCFFCIVDAAAISKKQLSKTKMYPAPARHPAAPSPQVNVQQLPFIEPANGRYVGTTRLLIDADVAPLCSRGTKWLDRFFDEYTRSAPTDIRSAGTKVRRTSTRKQQQQQQQQRLCRGDIICANVGSNIAGTTRVSRRALCKMRLGERASASARAMRATPRAGQRDAALFRHPFLPSFLSLTLLSVLSAFQPTRSSRCLPAPFRAGSPCRFVLQIPRILRASPSHREIARTGFYIKNLAVYCFIAPFV